MTTYAPIRTVADDKTAIPSPDNDAFIIGDNKWYISDNDINDFVNRGIPIPAGVPYRLKAGAEKYAWAPHSVLLRMNDV